MMKTHKDLIDPKRIYAIGLSNGGLFLSTLMADRGVPLAAACNYMGGYQLATGVLTTD